MDYSSRLKILVGPLVVASLSACQVPNPAFGLETGAAASSTDATASGPGASASSTDPSEGSGTPGTTDAPDPTTSSSSPTDPVTSTDPTDPTDPTATSSTGPVSTTDPIPPGCGDGVLDGDEECDDANDDATDDCTNTCQFAKCSDGVVWAGVEECDDGNDKSFDGCTSECQTTCHNGVWDFEQEECDPTAPEFGQPPLAGLCDDACRIEACFRMDNTEAPDFDSEGWFDACAGAPGLAVAVLVRTHHKIVYFAAGPKPPMSQWSPEGLTSLAEPKDQWKFSNHAFKVKLADLLVEDPNAFDVLYAFSRNSGPGPADQATCPSSLGDGYALAIMPEQNTGAARLLLMPHTGNQGARNLAGWDALGPAAELSHLPGGLMQLCDGEPVAAPFLGHVAVAVY